jgi:putative transcriptional regulator
MTQVSEGFLEGQLLVAMPTMGDTRFERTVIFLCAHSSEGAMGIIVNRMAENVSFVELLHQLGITGDADEIRLPDSARQIRVHQGGPVETGRGFVLHSSDFYLRESTLVTANNVCLTATVEILKAIAAGRGPSRALLALGYAGWAPGQLEKEIQENGWLTCPADMSLLFDNDVETKYDRALAKLGIDLSLLSGSAGNA